MSVVRAQLLPIVILFQITIWKDNKIALGSKIILMQALVMTVFLIVCMHDMDSSHMLLIMIRFTPLLCYW